VLCGAVDEIAMNVCRQSSIVHVTLVPTIASLLVQDGTSYTIVRRDKSLEIRVQALVMVNPFSISLLALLTRER
jgi:hypothetical protein